MTKTIDLAKFKSRAKLKDRYAKQLQRLQQLRIATSYIEEAVDGATSNLEKSKAASLVIYGEPQSGKTEMMICLTAKLLDDGHPAIVHLMNDSVDLLAQNLTRFRNSGLAPAPRSLSEFLQSSSQSPGELVVFCKKNVKDLDKLVSRLSAKGKVVVIDDEADYATPNAKVNQGTKTKVNDRVGKLIGTDGCYIGVTATPARLDLNNTFKNDTAKWVNFPPHAEYTGQDTFFPLNKKIPYRLNLLIQGGSAEEARDAFVRFLVTVAYLNLYENGGKDENYTMLVHTSGKKAAHETDRLTIEKSVRALIDTETKDFDDLVTQVHKVAQELYPEKDAEKLTEYVVTNASRATLVVLNSQRDRKAAGENPTNPTSPFTIIIGGNIVSRGVTFPNLLAMFFTRNVKHKLQQDTYIQRARMFGARGKYLKHFELTIPSQLYSDWHRCFVLHKLALETINNKLGSPVWIGDNRVSVVAKSSIDNATVVLDKGEMSFGLFDFSPELDQLVTKEQRRTETLEKLQAKIGNEALPSFLIQYLRTALQNAPDSLAIHTASPIAGSADADQAKIYRRKGFMGKSQLEPKKFPTAMHHIKVFFNKKGKARLFYKFTGSIQFIQNLKSDN